MATRPTTAHRRRRREVTVRSAVAGLVTTMLLLSVKLGVERSDSTRQFQLMTYDLQQMHLASNREPKVVVVDISGIPLVSYDRFVRYDEPQYTPRDRILDVVAAIAERQPCAIGIDGDMSPNQRGYIDPSDPVFFRALMQIWERTGIPIAVGVDRTTGDAPERWLGNEEFAPLAAAMVIPSDTRFMPKLLFMYSGVDSGTSAAAHVEYAAHEAGSEAHTQSSAGRSPSGCRKVPLPDVTPDAALPSLSYGLTRGSLESAHGWIGARPLRWIVEPFAVRRISAQSSAWVGEFLVDYGGTLDALQREVACPIRQDQRGRP